MAALGGSRGRSSRSARFLLGPGIAKYWVASLLVFAVPMIASSILYEEIAGSPLGEAVSEALSDLERRASWLQDIENPAARAAAVFALILANNVIVAVIMAASSVTLLIPVGVLAFNGVMVGYVMGAFLRGLTGTVEAQAAAVEPSTIDLFVALTPHGIIEIPALALIAAPLLAAGKIGYVEAVKTSISLLPVTLALLAVAALVESTITVILLALVQAVG
ncbi:MAG: stage II sporulation protein M [Desulfurococcales archaeon]|nr:stage II sporulation protein M [Desulfurococcales archaeon]